MSRVCVLKALPKGNMVWCWPSSSHLDLSWDWSHFKGQGHQAPIRILPVQQPLPTRGIKSHWAEERSMTQAMKHWISKCVHTSEITAFFHVIMRKYLKGLLATRAASSSACQQVLLSAGTTRQTPSGTSEVTAQTLFFSQVMSLTAIMCPHFFPEH